MGHRHQATVEWRAGDGEPFASGRYSRAHRWAFDGGAEIAASASPLVVRPPLSDPAGVDPEEALVAALASCHMLFFLDLACREGLDVLSYSDRAEGEMGETDAGRTAMRAVMLHPEVRYALSPDREVEDRLHERAHDLCFIANSVNFPVHVRAVEGVERA